MNRFKKAISNEQPALIFLLKLLLLLCLVKSFFFIYNYKYNHGWDIHSTGEAIRVLGWSVYYDTVTVAIITLPFFLLTHFTVKKWLLIPAAWLSASLVILCFLLNLSDIFYFSFHRQRADADLFYVLRHPHDYSKLSPLVIILGMLFFCLAAGKYFIRQYARLIVSRANGTSFFSSSILLVFAALSLFTGSSKKIVPARPLTDVNAIQLPLTQNSLHTFLYSVYRSRESVIPSSVYMLRQQQQALFSINKKNINTSASPKNIVLFIMESVPYEFFDSSSELKPVLPFLDSLRNHATFYNNAFSYSYTSNKGITAILTGIPTITDIPLYHSGFASVSKTNIGDVLAQQGYSSSFFIGDNYDDFGFAKCCNWTGIQHYYSMESIPGYKKMEKHTMGLQDEYVLHFMQQQIKKTPEPFFSTFYNISTHYPNDLTKAWQEKLKQAKASDAMKSMMYYDACLNSFFAKAVKEPWFTNTIFIFCSDHWASPDPAKTKDDIVNSFRIPIMIFDPSDNSRKIMSNTVSQLDIMNTVLAYSGTARSKHNFTSYGQSLTGTGAGKRIVFTKINNSLYQAINDEYVLGFDADEQKRLYCYRYITDTKRLNNILPGKITAADSLELCMKAFLQTATLHYRNRLGGQETIVHGP